MQTFPLHYWPLCVWAGNRLILLAERQWYDVFFFGVSTKKWRHSRQQKNSYVKADSRFAPSQWETALLCNDVSRWLGASIKSALYVLCPFHVPVYCNIWSALPYIVEARHVAEIINWIVHLCLHYVRCVDNTSFTILTWLQYLSLFTVIHLYVSHVIWIETSLPFVGI